MASNTNAFSLLDEQAGAASRTKSKKSKNKKKDLAESAPPLASVPAEVVPSVDYDDGFQAVPAKGSKGRVANPPQGATDVHSAVEAVERAACAAATAGDLTALWRGWVQQARPRAALHCVDLRRSSLQGSTQLLEKGIKLCTSDALRACCAAEGHCLEQDHAVP